MTPRCPLSAALSHTFLVRIDVTISLTELSRTRRGTSMSQPTSGTVVDSSKTMSEHITAPPVRSRSVKFSLASGNRPNNGTGNGVDESSGVTEEQAARGSDGLNRRRFKVARVGRLIGL